MNLYYKIFLNHKFVLRKINLKNNYINIYYGYTSKLFDIMPQSKK